MGLVVVAGVRRDAGHGSPGDQAVHGVVEADQFRDALRRKADVRVEPGPQTLAAPPEFVRQDLVDELRGMTFRAVAAAMQASTAYLDRQALPDRLTALGKPLQVIFGDQDRRWRPSSAADYLVVPGARVDLLPGAGHAPILEDPPGTAALLLSFAALHADPTPRAT
ncbi:alpha/beta fold hydrolase [Kitasatospora sp. NPDC002965]|uniref:alpha/beta fold hydrolase n=1 Tax=Kitasatospora sp. NPDC002965 TaxID=3154775 RepID=UPI0033A75055